MSGKRHTASELLLSRLERMVLHSICEIGRFFALRTARHNIMRQYEEKVSGGVYRPCRTIRHSRAFSATKKRQAN